MQRSLVFDSGLYDRLNRGRGEVVKDLLKSLSSEVELLTAIDIGCGIGHFSRLLSEQGLEVTGIDGREENVEEARGRSTNITFRRYDAQDPAMLELGSFDLCFCFGLLYHLENPFLVVRHLYALTKKLLLVEAVTFPGTEPVMALIDEEIQEDQGLQYLAFYPTEACLVKMLYRAGFNHVYAFSESPALAEYRETPGLRRTRTMLAASREQVSSPLLVSVPEPASAIRPWDPESGLEGSAALYRLLRSARRSMWEKIASLKHVIVGGRARR